MERKSLISIALYFFSIILLKNEGGSVSFAQTYPVQLTTQLIPPYSGYLLDYADPSSEKLRMVLQFNDFSVPQYNIRLRLEIKGNGFSIVTKQIFNPPPILVQPGVPVMISSTDLAPYLNSSNLDFTGISQYQYEQGKALPEGHYTICVKAFDYYLSNTQVSNESCAQAWFTMSDPPFLNLPFCNTTVIPQIPQNILFQWTALNMGSPNSALNTEYDFELWEIRPDSSANPNQVVLSTPPIYKITTQQTLVNYGITEPELTLYMKYAWRVRARDLNGYDNFKNSGYSQVCTFTYGSAANVLDSAYALTLTAQGVTHRMGYCNWNAEKVFSKYLLQVRKQGTANWFDYRTNVNYEKVISLEPNISYEARVRGEGSDIPIGPWSNTAVFTTLKDPAIACNDQTIPIDPLQASPLPAAKAVSGLIIQSGQFEVVASEISSSGGPGWFKGKGYARVLGGFPLAVKWKNIYIDDNLRHQQGVIEALTKGISDWMHQYDVLEAEDNAIYTDGEIDSIYVNGNQVCIILQGNPTAVCHPVPSDANVLVIRDEDGNQYTVTTNPPPAEIEGPTNYLVASDDVLDVTDSMKVTFSASPAQKFGFDKKEYTAHGPNYELIVTKDYKNYFVPYKSLDENATDEVLADVAVKGFDKDLLSFKTKDGSDAVHSPGNTALQFKVTVPKTEAVYAWYNGKKIGKLNVQSYKPLSYKVVLVPVNSASLPPASALNDIYKQANIQWSVSTAPNFVFDLGTDGLEIPDATLMSKYSPEMRTLRDAYRQKDTAYDKNAYYVFVVPGFTDANFKGYMVRGRAVGFLASNGSMKDLAHELAHGAFGLEHTFPQIAKGTSNNLMDYATDTKLTKKQWDEMHTSLLIFNWLDSEEDAAVLDDWKTVLEILSKIKTAHQNDRSISKKELTAPQKVVTLNDVNLAGVNYRYIKLLVQYQWPWDSIHPRGKGKIKEVNGTFGGEQLDGLEIDKNVWVFVPNNRVANMKLYLTSPADRNFLLFVGGFIPTQEFIKYPDVVYQNDVWNYWGGIDASFINQITTYNTLYASGNDHVWTSNHVSMLNIKLSLASYLTSTRPLPQIPNMPGFHRRRNNGYTAANDLLMKLYKGTIPCRTKIIDGELQIIDTVDVVAHSMGYAYAVGMIEALRKAKIHIGRFYIIAPENPCHYQLPQGLEEAWQYGSDEANHPVLTLDGIAPQCGIPGIDGMGDKGGRVFIPVHDPKVKANPLDSHLAKNYWWIFNRQKGESGYVGKRN